MTCPHPGRGPCPTTCEHFDPPVCRIAPPVTPTPAIDADLSLSTVKAGSMFSSRGAERLRRVIHRCRAAERELHRLRAESGG